MEREFNTRLQAEEPVVTDDGSALQRFELKEDILSEQSGDAWYRHWNYVTGVWENTTVSETIYDSAKVNWRVGMRVWAKFMPDKGEWEIVGPYYDPQVFTTGTGTGTACQYTTDVAVVTGIYKDSMNIIATRVMLQFELGKLCGIGAASTLTLTHCCNEVTGTASGTDPMGEPGTGPCPGECTYQWQDIGPVPAWELIVDVCSQAQGCVCSPPVGDGTFLGEVRDGTCAAP